MISNENFQAILDLDLEPIKIKLMHGESGEGWSRAKADSVDTEYRRFLYLMKAFPEEQTAPLVEVDTFWHYHILDTMKYATDCDKAFGYFLHHFPYVGLGGEDDVAVRQLSGDRMRELYEATFGQSYAGAAETMAQAGTATPAFCGATMGKPAFCGATGANTGFCGASTSKAGSWRATTSKAAFCGARAAFCGATTAKAAFCGAATVKPAFCGASTTKAAFCGATTATPAFCGANTAKPAFCGASTAEPAFCGASTARAAFCGATTAKTAFCGANTSKAGARGVLATIRNAIRTALPVVHTAQRRKSTRLGALPVA